MVSVRVECCSLALLRGAVATAADTVKPTVAITSPIANARLSGTVTIAATASDAVGVTRMLLAIDGQTKLVQTGAATAPLRWNTVGLTDGVAHDRGHGVRRGLEHVEQTIQVTVDDVLAPTLAITSPGANAQVTGTVTVAATATDAVGVSRMTLSIDGKVVADRTGVTTLSYAWNTAALVERSAHVLAVTAYDAAGNQTTATRQVTIRDVRGPAVSFVAPAAGPLVTQSADVAITASDPSGVNRIILYVDGAPVAQRAAATSLDYLWDASALPLESVHTLQAVAVDLAGNTSDADDLGHDRRRHAAHRVLSRPAQGEVVSGLEMVEVQRERRPRSSPASRCASTARSCATRRQQRLVHLPLRRDAASRRRDRLFLGHGRRRGGESLV